jgi:excisionase family DNA binding protein
LIDNGTLHAFKVGRSWRFNRSEIAALAAGRKSN